MTRDNASNQVMLLLAIGPLFACATSVFTALIVVGVLLVCTLCATAVKKLIAQSSTLGRSADIRLVAITSVCAVIVGALVITLITLGFSDIVAAFIPQMVLAAFSAVLLGAGEKPMMTAPPYSAQIVLVGFLCELLGRGTLLGDYELAFAGATHGWLLRVTNFAPLPWFATPAGALLVAAAITAGLALRRARTAPNDAASAMITEPRSGRRVRVTGHIS